MRYYSHTIAGWRGGPDNFVVWVAKQQENLGTTSMAGSVSPPDALDCLLLQAAPTHVDKQPEPPRRLSHQTYEILKRPACIKKRMTV